MTKLEAKRNSPQVLEAINFLKKLEKQNLW